jgi:hypothetical protein
MDNKTLSGRLAEAVDQLLSSADGADIVLAPAFCISCCCSWGLRMSEDGQFLSTHKCAPGRRRPNYVIRLVAERIGETPFEREILAAAWRQRPRRD